MIAMIKWHIYSFQVICFSCFVKSVISTCRDSTIQNSNNSQYWPGNKQSKHGAISSLLIVFIISKKFCSDFHLLISLWIHEIYSIYPLVQNQTYSRHHIPIFKILITTQIFSLSVMETTYHIFMNESVQLAPM